jgi:hypothetical protein
MEVEGEVTWTNNTPSCGLPQAVSLLSRKSTEVAIQDRVIKTFSGRRSHQKIYKIYKEYNFNQKHRKKKEKTVLLQTCQTKRKFLGHTP